MTRRQVDLVQAAGRRHVGYGVREPDHATVELALLDAIEEALGPRFPAETRLAWNAACGFISPAMRGGAHSIEVVA